MAKPKLKPTAISTNKNLKPSTLEGEISNQTKIKKPYQPKIIIEAPKKSENKVVEYKNYSDLDF